MANMRKDKVDMSEQDPNIRNKNFTEVALGYTLEDAKEEASRCLHCKNKPCVSGCPVSVRIPEFIAAVSDGDIPRAYEIITSTNSLPAVCGRVCPQEVQCEAKCVRGIKDDPVGIGRLERFVADYMMDKADEAMLVSKETAEKNNHKVAVVGSGPAGLTCAGDLAKLGYDVTIFEAFHVAGGVLMYGIPEFRLPKRIVEKEINKLKDLGVKIETNMVIGKILSVDDLFDEGFEAIFIGSGAGLPSFMNIEGESLVGVYSANEFLTRVNLMKAYDEQYDTPIHVPKKVAVIGGGNVAMDAARSAKRLGSDVSIVYRRSEEEMPARGEEIHHAKEEGVALHVLHNPVKINGDDEGRAVSVTCVKMELGEPDASGRRKPIPIEGSETDIEADAVIMALGSSPNPLIRTTTKGIESNKRGCLVADPDTLATTRAGVYAGGDAVSGAATVILAMGAGKTAAKSMDEYIRAKK